MFKAYADTKQPGGPGCLLSRTAFYDREITGLLESGQFKQLVVMGAGFDTRPYRFADLIEKKGVKAFELDRPPLQGEKRARLTHALGTPPTSVTYVPTDFNLDSLPAVLAATSYNAKAKTIFLWEGVNMYLQPEAVTATLRMIRELSPPGSVLLTDSLSHWDNGCYGGVALAKVVAERGEPFTFTQPESEIRPFYENLGYKVLTHLSAQALDEEFNYFDGKLIAPTLGCWSVLIAETNA